MAKKTFCGALCLLAALAMGLSNVSAAGKIKKEKLQVFIMLGQSNMVGLADIRTFQYLLQEPYQPSFLEIEKQLKGTLYYRKIYSDFGYELEQKMLRDPQYFTLDPRAMRGKVRKDIIDTIPADPKLTERYIYDDMIRRVEARIPLRKKLAERFIKGATEADFAKLGSLGKEVKNLPEVKADPRAERLAYAKLVQDTIHLPIAKRTWIAGYGAFQAVDGLDDSKIRRLANGPLSIGWGAGYTKIGPEYGFGIAMEEKLDAPIRIIKCAWGNTQLAGAWRPPSAPPRTETAEQKALREARNAALKAKAEAEGKEFKGNVFTVDTMPWFPTELSYLNELMYDARKATENAIKAGKSEPNYKTSKQYAEWDKYKGTSNAGYHYMGSAEFFVEIGDAFAKALVGMTKEKRD